MGYHADLNSVLTPGSIQSNAETEQQYQQARDSWSSQHPDVALSQWSPTYIDQAQALQNGGPSLYDLMLQSYNNNTL